MIKSPSAKSSAGMMGRKKKKNGTMGEFEDIYNPFMRRTSRGRETIDG